MILFKKSKIVSVPIKIVFIVLEYKTHFTMILKTNRYQTKFAKFTFVEHFTKTILKIGFKIVCLFGENCILMCQKS